MPLTTCEACGTATYVSQSRLERGKGRYCSRACHDASRRLPRSENCAYCGTPMLPRRRETRYCSRRCAALALHNDSQAVRACRVCRTPFSSSSAKDRYCSGACEARHAAASGKVRLMGDPWRLDRYRFEDDDPECARLPDFTLGF